MFKTLQPWVAQVLSAIKKDIKSEHLPSNPPFYRTYFGNRPQNRLTNEEVFAAYEKELLQDNADLAEWVVNRWVFKHGDLYTHFAERLSQINPEFSEIQSLTEEESEQVLAGAAEQFGSVPVFLFSALNGVVFPKPILERLETEAKGALEKQDAAEKAKGEEQLLTQKIEQQQREIARFEAKLAGVQKKYETETAALKKQIRALQQRLK